MLARASDSPPGQGPDSEVTVIKSLARRQLEVHASPAESLYDDGDRPGRDAGCRGGAGGVTVTVTAACQ